MFKSHGIANESVPIDFETAILQNNWHYLALEVPLIWIFYLVIVLAKTILLAKQQVDVTGNGVADNILLIGYKDAANGGLVTDINIVVIEGKTKKVINSNIKGFTGYQPKINFIGDFNGDKSKDAMITVYSGGKNGAFQVKSTTVKKSK